MPRVRFDGRGRLIVYGRLLESGQSLPMSDEQAAALLAHPHIKVTVLPEPEADRGEGQQSQEHHEEEE